MPGDFCQAGKKGWAYLFEQLPERDQNLSLATLFIGCSRIFWDIKSRYAQSPACTSYADQIFQNDVGFLLIATLVDGLISHTIDGSVHHSSIGFDDLVDSIGFAEVNRGALRDFSGRSQSLRDTVNDVDARGAEY